MTGADGASLSADSAVQHVATPAQHSASRVAADRHPGRQFAGRRHHRRHRALEVGLGWVGSSGGIGLAALARLVRCGPSMSWAFWI